jgi:hypothetical protein
MGKGGEGGPAPAQSQQHEGQQGKQAPQKGEPQKGERRENGSQKGAQVQEREGSSKQQGKQETQKEQRGEPKGKGERNDAAQRNERNERNDAQRGERGGDRKDAERGEQRGGQRTGDAGSHKTLTVEQKTKVRETVLRGGNAPRVTNVNFNISVGTVVPTTVRVVELPPVLIEYYPDWRGYFYFVYNDEIIIVDRNHHIVAVLEV